MKCKDGTVFTDGDIIECLYNSKSTGHLDKWIPTRVRDVLSPNDFTTANNVWKSFHYPITLKDVTMVIWKRAKKRSIILTLITVKISIPNTSMNFTIISKRILSHSLLTRAMC